MNLDDQISLIPRRVQNGVEFLNEFFKSDWWNRINLSVFSIENCNFCILGQLDGDYYDFLRYNDIDENSIFPDEHGFSGLEELTGVNQAVYQDIYLETLNKEWVEVISKLQTLNGAGE